MSTTVAFALCFTAFGSTARADDERATPPTQGSDAPAVAAPAPAITPAPESAPASETAAAPTSVQLANDLVGTDAPGAEEGIGDLGLEDLLKMDVVKIVTATKSADSVLRAPAIVEVITRDEISHAGYRTVGEALARVPGLVVSTDHVFTTVGMRGISGGIRGGSRHIKLLIDGQPVAFRPDAQNFLGAELIPMSAVEQIEVIRGPASSVYGINAFLGVVNIITRRAKTLPFTGLAALEGAVSSGWHLDGGAEGVAGYNSETLDVLLAVHYSSEDRSGLKLPKSSPDGADYVGNNRGKSDFSRPLSAFGHVAYETGSLGSLRLLGGFQSLNARGEYLDTGALSHRTTVNLRNWYTRLEHSLELSPLTLRSFVAYQGGGPGGDDVILPMVLGQPTSQEVRRDFGFSAFTAGLEPQLTLGKSSVSGGVELDTDHEELRRNTFVSRDSGLELQGTHAGSKQFTDVGIYAQGLFRQIDNLSLNANLRYDISNQYGNNLNYRAAAVYSFTDNLYAKILSGSSYRPPSPEQLYGSAIQPGGVQGTLASSTPVPLDAQTAVTHEMLVGWADNHIWATVSGFYTRVAKRIEYVRSEGNLLPRNLADSVTTGAEASLRGQWQNILEGAHLGLWASAAYQHTTFSVREPVTERERDLLSINEMYPSWTGSGMVDLDMPAYFLVVNFRMTAYGERLQSQSNQSIGRPFVDDPLRHIRPSYPLDATVAYRGLSLFGRRTTVVRLGLYNALNTASAEPGFAGINVPPRGRRVLLTLSQEL